MEAVENGGHPDASEAVCGDVGVAPGNLGSAGAEDQPTVEQWQAALQELCKNAQASGQPQAYFTNPIAGAQGYGLWSAQPLLAAYGAIPFFSGTFPGGYAVPPTSVPPSSPNPKDEEGEESGGASSEARPPTRPSKRVKTRGGARQQEDAKTSGLVDTPKSSSPRASPTAKSRAWTPPPTIAPGKGGLSIDALAAAARAAVRSHGTSSSDFWQGADCGVDQQKAAFLDEKELKRQRRKQSNRESARRSRLRKQQECENLHSQVRELTEENVDLRKQVHDLQELVEQMRQGSGQAS